SSRSRYPRQRRTMTQIVCGLDEVLIYFNLAAPHLLHSAQTIISKNHRVFC
ncbi:hypothetical protein COCVIDRAFT_91603, partial [Bipolaris victoriae FI3]